MKRIHLHDTVTGKVRTITTTGGGVKVHRRKTEVEVDTPPEPVDAPTALTALRRSLRAPDRSALHERLDEDGATPFIRVLIDAGFFDRYRKSLDNGRRNAGR